jgi:soluble lytic murein transglycosylase-like protein
MLLPMFYVVAVNHTVRRFGGDAHLLSISRLPEKSSALARLALHSVRHLWSDACSDTERYVREAAIAEGVPPSFAASIARAESGFRSHSISSTGAMGVMQLMPATAARHGVWDPFDPHDNAQGAAKYLKVLWTRYHGNRMRVAAAYNAGEGAVPRKGRMRVPDSTLSYASTVVKHDDRAQQGAVHRVIDALTAPLVITANGD